MPLNYELFTLEWTGIDGTSTIRLDGNTHDQILKWIGDSASKASLDRPYAYDFHYDLPYTVEDNFTFKLLDSNRLSELTHLRILAQLVLEKFLNDNELSSEIRVWPHHFDTGAYATLKKDPRMAVGLGLAIPDTVVNEHYFYISVYGNNGAIAPDKLQPLSHGQWLSDGFTGAVLPAAAATVQTASSFFQEALESLS